MLVVGLHRNGITPPAAPALDLYTFETYRRLPRMSVHWETPEVTGEPRELRN
jgi:hypothetical protein